MRKNSRTGVFAQWWSLINDFRTSLEENENMLHINAFVEFAKTCE